MWGNMSEWEGEYSVAVAHCDKATHVVRREGASAFGVGKLMKQSMVEGLRSRKVHVTKEIE